MKPIKCDFYYIPLTKMNKASLLRLGALENLVGAFICGCSNGSICTWSFTTDQLVEPGEFWFYEMTFFWDHFNCLIPYYLIILSFPNIRRKAIAFASLSKNKSLRHLEGNISAIVEGNWIFQCKFYQLFCVFFWWIIPITYFIFYYFLVRILSLGSHHQLHYCLRSQFNIA